MDIIYAKAEELSGLLSSGSVLVDFYADWCGPCRMLAPLLVQLAENNSDLQIVKVNVEENPSVGEDWGVQGIPALVLYKDGQEIDRSAGFRPLADLQTFVDQALDTTEVVEEAEAAE